MGRMVIRVPCWTWICRVFLPCVSYALLFMLCVCPVMRVHVSCIAIYVCTVSITVDMPPCEQSYP